MAGSIAVSRKSSGNQIESVVHQLADRDRNGELLTALRHFPRRKRNGNRCRNGFGPN